MILGTPKAPVLRIFGVPSYLWNGRSWSLQIS